MFSLEPTGEVPEGTQENEVWSADTPDSDRSTMDEYHEYLRNCRGSLPQAAPQFETWSQRQLARLARLEGSPTQPLTVEQREFLERYFIIGPSVLVCNMPIPPDLRMIGFAMDTPAANILLNHAIEAVNIMASRMEMLTSEGRDPAELVEDINTSGVPLVLFCAVARGQRKPVLVQASISVSGSRYWYTHMGNWDRQILLKYTLGDFQPMVDSGVHFEFVLAYPENLEEDRLHLEEPPTIRSEG